MAPLGFAVIADDALEHGEHPTNEDDGSLAALRFLGIDLSTITVDTLALRGNFNQTAVDRLQLIELIRDDPDVDGDGEPDLDVTRLAYWGISLGGMMGPSLLALTDDIGAAILSVGGGGLLTFVTDNSQVALMRPMILQLVGSEAEFERLLVVAQALVDPADPATFAPNVLSNRLSGTDEVPDLLFPVALTDQTVPAATGQILARALGIPHIPPVSEPVEIIPVETAMPVSGNIADGEATAGYFQFDRVSDGRNAQVATHDNTPLGPEGAAQAVEFFTTWNEDGMARIIDPYELLGTRPLP
jgi:hypothetical protein